MSEVLELGPQIRDFKDTSWVLIFKVNPSEKDCRRPDDRNHYLPAIQNSKLIGMVNTEPLPFGIADKSCQYICKDSQWLKLKTKMLHYKIVVKNEYEYKLVLQGSEDDEDYGDTSKASTYKKKERR